MKSFPVVHESAGRLLETGINTLQKTLLLKKEVEVSICTKEYQRKLRLMLVSYESAWACMYSLPLLPSIYH